MITVNILWKGKSHISWKGKFVLPNISWYINFLSREYCGLLKMIEVLFIFLRIRGFPFHRIPFQRIITVPQFLSLFLRLSHISQDPRPCSDLLHTWDVDTEQKWVELIQCFYSFSWTRARAQESKFYHKARIILTETSLIHKCPDRDLEDRITQKTQ